MQSNIKRFLPPAWRKRLSAWRGTGIAVAQDPVSAYRALLNWPAMQRGQRIAAGWRDESQAATAAVPPASAPNPLWDYFSGHNTGPGIFKVRHYFEIYHRHLARFVGQPARLAEVGVLGGGSLAMWADYLGPQSQIYGIDIQPECRRHARDNIAIYIGDQGDRRFWAAFKQQIGPIDILIDDGGHRPEQQMVTLEEMLPWLRPGGVFICEDIRGIDDALAAFASRLACQLNHCDLITRRRWATSPFQQTIHSIHFYPFLLVIEKREQPLLEITSIAQGTEWPDYFPIKAKT